MLVTSHWTTSIRNFLLLGLRTDFTSSYFPDFYIPSLSSVELFGEIVFREMAPWCFEAAPQCCPMRLVDPAANSGSQQFSICTPWVRPIQHALSHFIHHNVSHCIFLTRFETAFFHKAADNALFMRADATLRRTLRWVRLYTSLEWRFFILSSRKMNFWTLLFITKARNKNVTILFEPHCKSFRYGGQIS